LDPPHELLGKKVACPSCNAEFVLPKDESISEPIKSESPVIAIGKAAKRAKGAKKKSGNKKIERAATEEQLNLLAGKIPISNRAYTRSQASKLIVENPQKSDWVLKGQQKLTILQALLKSQMGELQRLVKALQAEDLDNEHRSDLETDRDELRESISFQKEEIEEHKQDEKEELLGFQEAMTDDYEGYNEVIKKPTLAQVKQACAALDAQNPRWRSEREGLPDPDEVLCNTLLATFPSLRKTSSSEQSKQSAPRSKKGGQRGCLLLFAAVLAVWVLFRILIPEQQQDEPKSGPAERAEKPAESTKPKKQAETLTNPLLGIRTPLRTWRNKKGDELEAALIRLFKMDGVYHGDFQRPNGTVFTYKIGNFSETDIDFVKGLLEKQRESEQK